MATPDPNSTFTICDSGGRPIQCQSNAGVNVYTADSLNGDADQDWGISDPTNTLLACALNPNTTLMLGAASFSEGADVQTFALSMSPTTSCWQCNDDGSIELLQDGAPSGLLLTSLIAGSMNQLKVSKSAPKQTWTWNKKLQKGSGNTA